MRLLAKGLPMENLEKLKQLEQNILLLAHIKEELTLEDIIKNKRYEWEIRYGLFESIQIVIDIACKVTAKYNLGHPKSYKECIELLCTFKYIDETLSHKLLAMIGLRNLLIHEYATIDIQKLYAYLDFLDDFAQFANSVTALGGDK